MRIGRLTIIWTKPTRQPTRRQITPELLQQVLDLHAVGGIRAVEATLNYSERNARRLLARARNGGD